MEREREKEREKEREIVVSPLPSLAFFGGGYVFLGTLGFSLGAQSFLIGYCNIDSSLICSEVGKYTG